MRPQRAVGQGADRMAGILHRGEAGQPGRAIRLASPLPEPVVANTQPPAGPAVTAALYDADGEILAPEPLRGRRRGEHVDVGAPLVLPLVVVAFAEPPSARLTDTARHPAGRGIEHQRAALGDEDVHPELWTDCGHELTQQPRRRSLRGHRLRRGHHRTSCPVRKPAASSALRASSTDK